MKDWNEILQHNCKVFMLNEDNMNELFRNRNVIRETIMEYAKQFQPIKVTVANIPEKECIAIGYQNECLVGYISYVDEKFICENDNELLEEVTHFMLIPQV